MPSKVDRECQEMAKFLDISWQNVKKFLYEYIKENDLYGQILNDDRYAIECVFNSRVWKEMENHYFKTHPKVVVRQKEILDTRAKKLRMALWFIEQYATPTEAVEALKMAIEIHEET